MNASLIFLLDESHISLNKDSRSTMAVIAIENALKALFAYNCLHTSNGPISLAYVLKALINITRPILIGQKTTWLHTIIILSARKSVYMVHAKTVIRLSEKRVVKLKSSNA